MKEPERIEEETNQITLLRYTPPKKEKTAIFIIFPVYYLMYISFSFLASCYGEKIDQP